MSERKIDVGLLAGGKGRRLGMGVAKVLIPLRGKPIYEYTLDAALGVTDELVSVVCPVGSPIINSRVRVLESKGSYISDLFQLFEPSGCYRRLLIINADTVMVTSESLASFLSMTEDSTAGLVWPAIRRKAMPTVFQTMTLNDLPGRPDLIRSGVMLFRPDLLHPNPAVLKRMADHPRYGEVYVLGVWKCLRWLFKALSMESMVRSLGEVLGCKVNIPECDIWRFGFDVDTPEELQVAEHLLRRG